MPPLAADIVPLNSSPKVSLGAVVRSVDIFGTAEEGDIGAPRDHHDDLDLEAPDAPTSSVVQISRYNGEETEKISALVEGYIVRTRSRHR
jgi:hypothetical protein